MITTEQQAVVGWLHDLAGQIERGDVRVLDSRSRCAALSVTPSRDDSAQQHEPSQFIDYSLRIETKRRLH